MSPEIELTNLLGDTECRCQAIVTITVSMILAHHLNRHKEAPLIHKSQEILTINGNLFCYCIAFNNTIIINTAATVIVAPPPSFKVHLSFEEVLHTKYYTKYYKYASINREEIYL